MLNFDGDGNGIGKCKHTFDLIQRPKILPKIWNAAIKTIPRVTINKSYMFLQSNYFFDNFYILVT